MEKAFKRLASATWPIPSTCTATGPWCTNIRYPETCWRMSHGWKARRATNTSSRPRARRRPSPTFAILRAASPRRHRRAIDATGRTRAAGAGRGRPVPRTSHWPDIQHDFPSSSWADRRLRTRSVRRSRAHPGLLQRAGIRVVMITGDYPGTARQYRATDRLVSIRKRCITGPEMDELSDDELQARIARRPSSRASSRNKSCASSTRSRPTAKSWP